MLSKRTKSFQKNQHMCKMAISDTLGSSVKSNSIFEAPLLFVGLDPEGLLDSDSVRSPTSPLDVTFLSNKGKPSRRWDCSNKVGLSIIDSLEDNARPNLSPQMVIKTANCKTWMESVKTSKSLPKDFCKLPYTKNTSIFHKGESSTVVFEIGETLLENNPFGKTSSCSIYSNDFATFNQVSSPPHFIGGSQNSNTFLPTESNATLVSLCSSNDFVKSLSASEIELSEDYTCVISHGPNPKTTHIFCDCILEIHSDDFKNKCKNEENKEGVSSLVVNGLETPNQYPYSDFLSLCFQFKKKLEEGRDIYIYRGEKSFCSLACRSLEIMIDEELEKSNPVSENSSKCEIGEELFETDIITNA